MKFVYEIDESIGDVVDVQESFTSTRNPEAEECIKIDKDDSVGGIAIIANQKGWEYLAKLCYEMAYCSVKDPAFHLHKKKDLTDASNDEETAVSFYVQG